MATDYTGDHSAGSHSAFVHDGALGRSGLRDIAVQDRVLGMFRDLLVHVDGGQAGRRRVQFAADLAVRMSARLSGLHVVPPVEVPPRYKPSLVAEAAAAISERLAANARAAATTFRQEATQRLADARWFEATGDISQGICRQARHADLVILGQHEGQGSPETHPLPIAHSVVFRCGRPVLVVPPAVQRCAIEKVVVAWDGSREAVRAIHDALPLLHLSQSIDVVTTPHRPAADDEVDTNSMLAHLAVHGIEPKTKVLQTASADELRRQLEQGCYDLLVMRGRAHPTWLEFAMGGYAQAILLSAKMPIFVSC
jgi:nucleotide-binding universal stress UspA family protein